MTDITNGIAPSEHIAILNANFTELFGVGNFTPITSELIGQSLIDVLTQNYQRSIVAIGNKGSYVIASTNNAFGPQIYYVKNGGNDNLSGLSDLEAWAYHPWMADYTGKTILKAGDTVKLKRGDSWIKSNPATHWMVVSKSGTIGQHIRTTAYGDGDRPLIKIDTNTAYCVIYATNKSFFTFDNLHIQHFSRDFYSNRHGIFLAPICHDVIIYNCEIDNIPADCILANTNAYNILIGNELITECATLDTHSNHIHDFGHGGVVLLGCNPDTLDSNFKVIGNYIHDSSPIIEGANAYGIAITASSQSAAWPTNAIIDYNRVENIPTWEGIETHGATYLYIRNNYVYNFCRGIYAFNTHSTDLDPELHHIWIENNIVKHPGIYNPNNYIYNDGFIVVAAQLDYRGNNIFIINNKCSYVSRPDVNLLYGIYFRNIDGIEIVGNEISNGGTSGLAAIANNGYSTEILEENNVITNWN